MQAQDSAGNRNKRGNGGEWQETRNGRTIWVVSHAIAGQRPKTWRDVSLSVAQAKRQKYRDQLARGEIVPVRQTLREQLAEADELLVIHPGSLVTDYVRYWLEHSIKPDGEGDERERGKQPTTEANYVYIAERWVYPSRALRTKLDNLQLEDAEAFWQEISRADKNGKRAGFHMRRRALIMLRTVINWVILHRPRSTSLRWNPFASVIADLRVPAAKKKPAPSASNLERILSAAQGQDQLELFIQIALNFGLRRGNLAAMQARDFDGSRLLVRRRLNRITGRGLVTRGGLKSQDEGVVSQKPLNPSQVVLFGRLVAEQRARNLVLFAANQPRWVGPDPRAIEAPLFPTRKGTPTDPNELYRRFKALVASVDLPEYTVHQLRHDFISIGLAQGRSSWEMAQAADHSTVKMIETTYGHVMPEQLAATFSDVGSWLADRHAATG